MSATVIVPLDGTLDALGAMPVALELARLRGATMHVLHVGERAMSPTEVLDQLNLAPDTVRGAVIHGAAGDPAEVIARLVAEHADATIVMATNSGPPTAAGGTLGPVAERVLHDVRFPVVFVRPGRAGTWQLRKLLLPHDATPTTSAAIRPAAELIVGTDASMSVVYVAAPGKAPREPGSVPVPRYMDQRQYELPAWASEFLDRLTAVTPMDRSRLRFHLGHGDPGEEILRAAAADNADLIVLSWRGAMELERAHIIKQVLHEAACPVMVLRSPEAA